MRDHNFRTPRTDEPTSSAPIAIPASCPACQSSSIVTKMQNPDADSYWRCTKCGEVWNDTRRRGTPRRGVSGWR
jgi:predicted Zn finger-like uncharacterized protein